MAKDTTSQDTYTTESPSTADKVQSVGSLDSDKAKAPRFQKVVEGVYDLSLGISIIVAVVIGYGIGYGLQKLTGISWLLWLGIGWGVAAAFLNIYKAYKRHKKELDELAKNPRYNAHKYLQDSQDVDDEDDPYDR
ncbi:AtpZ/AtpI family protein [Helicobacter equorum]|uniref:AtpZ/AtpI family protein n=1 Tax=Helicobacter equorum TaxID=361872 RepID=UPI000CF18718|nr:AtpZ/AtpI family protein [Helicobacter equorum]